MISKNPGSVSVHNETDKWFPAGSDDGEAIRCQGTTESLRALAQFTANELECSSFAEYGISGPPPYEETVLTITGPDGTRQMFHEGLVNRLEEESTAGRLSG